MPLENVATKDQANTVSSAIQDHIDTLQKRECMELDKIVHVKTFQGLDCHIQRRNVLSHITIHVKVFHGDRKRHSIKVSIVDKLESIIEKL